MIGGHDLCCRLPLSSFNGNNNNSSLVCGWIVDEFVKFSSSGSQLLLWGLFLQNRFLIDSLLVSCGNTNCDCLEYLTHQLSLSMLGCWKSAHALCKKLMQFAVSPSARNFDVEFEVFIFNQKVRFSGFTNNFCCGSIVPNGSWKSFCTVAGVSENATSDQGLLALNPNDFAEYLKSKDINRCYIAWDEELGKAVSSHPELHELAEWVNGSKYYQKHEAIFMHLGMRTGSLMAAFVWRTDRGQACGGIRLTNYPTLQAYMKDGLRLSIRMGMKAALSGIWAGGGKGLIPEPKNKQHINPDYRQKLFCDYGDFISSLNGCYVAGIDIGINLQDLYNVHSRTRWTICIPEDIGGSGNPAKLLGKGVICGIEAALDHLNRGSLSNKKVAVQGAGAVGMDVASRLLDHGSEVFVTDTSKKRVHDIRDLLAPKAKGRLRVEKVPIGDLSLLEYDCDILSPCAIGHILTPVTIPKIKAKIICGTANAQLDSEEDCKILTDMGITYVFEFLPNRMAMVNSVYENYGRMYRDPEIDRHFDKESEFSIYVLTKKILEEASEKQITVFEAARELAEEHSRRPHPLWPGRTKAIIQRLIDGGWHLGKDFWRKRRNFATSEGLI